MSKQVVIVQRRMTNYRVPLFQQLKESLARRDIRLRVIAGSATPDEQARNDAGRLDWQEPVATRYLLGDRLCWQNYGRQIETADLVIAGQENRLLYNLVALSSRQPRRFAFWGHGANLQTNRPDGLRERFKKWTTRRADWWFAYTESSRDRVVDAGFSGDRVSVLNNAIDTRKLCTDLANITDHDLALFLNRLSLSGSRTGLYLGSLYAEKRIDLILEAALRVRRHIPDFQFIVAGEGSDRHLVEAFCRQHPWCHHVGTVSGEGKALCLKAADVIMSPCALGLVVLDSFNAGVPIVTMKNANHSPEVDYLEDRHNALFSEATLDAYAGAVLDVLTRPALASTLKQGCLSSAGNYSLDAMARRFEDGIVAALAV